MTSYDLQEHLEQRYGPAFSQQIIEEIRKTEQLSMPAPVDMSAMKEMGQFVSMFRAQAVQALWRMRSWRKKECAAVSNRMFLDMEGEFLARQLSDALSLYRESNRHYHEAVKETMRYLKAPYYSQHAA